MVLMGVVHQTKAGDGEGHGGRQALEGVVLAEGVVRGFQIDQDLERRKPRSKADGSGIPSARHAYDRSAT